MYLRLNLSKITKRLFVAGLLVGNASQANGFDISNKIKNFIEEFDSLQNLENAPKNIRKSSSAVLDLKVVQVHLLLSMKRPI